MTAITVESSQQLNAIAPITLQQWLQENSINLVDVREPSEYSGEHIEGAKLVALSQFDPMKVPQESDKTLVLYCQTQNRSQEAGRKLLASGWTDIYYLQGGMNAWKEAKYPTKINKNAPISIMRQVQIVAGSLVFTGTILGAFVSPWFLILSGFVGAGLVFAGVSNTCAMGMLLAKLPYNQRV